MAISSLSINVKMPSDEVAKLTAWFDTMPDHERHRFASEWAALEDAGAQIADVGFCYGVMHAWISHDFMTHAARFGFSG